MGIAIHNLSSAGESADQVRDLSAAVRQNAAGILGTTVQMADLVLFIPCESLFAMALMTIAVCVA